jgi:transcription elongation factor Elf1
MSSNATHVDTMHSDGCLCRECLQRKAEENANRGFELNEKLVCPHCQDRGYVETRATKIKKGISGGKATGAVLTGGLSLLATGLSRKEQATEAKCSNCGSRWVF